MRERVTTGVSAGEVLQVHSSRGPIGHAITVPDGVSSVTIIFRDTEAVKAAEAKRKERRKARRGLGRKRKSESAE